MKLALLVLFLAVMNAALADPAMTDCVDYNEHCGVVGSVSAPDSVRDVVVSGSLAYLAAETAGLLIVDISNPEEPQVIGNATTAGPACGVAVSGGLAYVAAGYAGLQVVEISDPRHPRIVGTADTPDAAYSVDVADDYAYVAGGASGLLVITISDPAHPTVIGSVVLSETLVDAAAVSVAAQGGYAYVAGEQSGFFAVDVTSPTSPRVVYDMSTMGCTYDVALSTRRAFVADGTAGLRVFDISEPASPREIEHEDMPGEAHGVTVVNNDFVYVACGDAGLVLVHFKLYFTRIFGRALMPGYACAVSIAGRHAYVGSGSFGMQVVDIKNVGYSPHIVSLETPGQSQGIAIVRAHAFIADGDEGLQVIDISDPRNPALVGHASMSGTARDVDVQGEYAYVCDNDFQVFDISDPSSPRIVGSLETTEDLRRAYVAGDYAYAAARCSGLRVIDIEDPAAPRLVGSLAIAGGVRDLAVEGDYAYLADCFHGIHVVNVADPDVPRIVSQAEVPESSLLVSVAGGYAYVASEGFLFIFDVTTPEQPRFEGDRLLGGESDAMAICEDQIYVTYGSRMTVFDISNPLLVLPVGFASLPGSNCTGIACSDGPLCLLDEDGGLGTAYAHCSRNRPPSRFALVEPLDGASVESRQPVLLWHPARVDDGGAVEYTLYWSEDVDFRRLSSACVGTNTSYGFGPEILERERTYWWKIRAQDENGLIRWCDPPGGLSFDVTGDALPPEPFSLLAPASEEELHTTKPTFRWQAALDGDPGDSVRYTVYWSRTQGFNDEQHAEAGVETTFTFGSQDLEPGQRCYWRVKAIDTHGLNRLSEPPSGWRFYVSNNVLRPFSLTQPGDDEIVLENVPTLQWQAAADGDPGYEASYTVFWSRDSSFAESESVVVPVHSACSLDDGSLVGNATHYWKVRAQDSLSRTRWANPPEGWAFAYRPLTPSVLSLRAEIMNLYGPITVSWEIPTELEATGCTLSRREAGESDWHVMVSYGVAEGVTYEYVDGSVEPGTAYDYGVTILGPRGAEGPWGPVQASLPEPKLSLKVAPNPGSSTLSIILGMPRSGDAVLRLFDVTGRQIACKELDELRLGEQMVRWEVESQGRWSSLSGAFWLCLETEDGRRTTRCVVIR